MKTAPKTAPATAFPSSGSSSPPSIVWLPDLNSAPMVDKIRIANTDKTMLVSVSLTSPLPVIVGPYQVHAFMAETSGFTILGNLKLRGRSGSFRGVDLIGAGA